jgi:hypothetical protein
MSYASVVCIHNQSGSPEYGKAQDVYNFKLSNTDHRGTQLTENLGKWHLFSDTSTHYIEFWKPQEIVYSSSIEDDWWLTHLFNCRHTAVFLL